MLVMDERGEFLLESFFLTASTSRVNATFTGQIVGLNKPIPRRRARSSRQIVRGKRSRVRDTLTCRSGRDESGCTRQFRLVVPTGTTTRLSSLDTDTFDALRTRATIASYAATMR
ncbi:PREDICTED: uncharacterized protein LOC105143529 [Acromyrmex echinatior]|uniref:uncharacterized protein LOC105143529 n=1 Tax=Acromyrmex echinatior TaxID=103372 RepID=UPI000580B47C|nr:PREDICTED: uncharacterized protein LOC105143529 [Acromyrmex echinatior]